MRRQGQRHGKIRVRVCGCISSNTSSLSFSSYCCFQLQFGFKSGETFGLQRFCYNNVMDMEIEDKLLAGKIRRTADPHRLSNQQNCFVFPCSECMPLPNFLLFSHLSKRNVAIQTMSWQISCVGFTVAVTPPPARPRGGLVIIII